MSFVRTAKPYALLAAAVAAGVLGTTPDARGQDVRLAQPYASGLLLNPAMAGLTALRTIGLATRNQNPEAGNVFLSGAISGDGRLPRLRGSVGFTVAFDRAGDAPVNRTQVQGVYAYQSRLSTHWAVSGGVSAGAGLQSGSLNRYVFGDQLLPDGSTGATAEINDFFPTFYPTVGVGLVAYDDRHAWVGAALHHANSPRLGTGAVSGVLPRRLVLHGGYKFYLLNARTLNRYYELSVTPLATVQMQGAARGIDVGFSSAYSPIVFGVLYRNPLLMSAMRDQRWLVGQLGLRRPGLSVGYSYELGMGRQTAGFSAHELTIRLDQADFSGLHRKRRAPKQAPFIAAPAF